LTAIPSSRSDWNWRHLGALIGGNLVLALGPWSVRLADTGPVSAGFWRLALALPVLAGLALANGQSLRLARPALIAMLGAGVFFAADLASWHLGIARTKIANATLFGNAGSLVMMGWGIVAMGRRPRAGEWAAVASALIGAAILMGRSLELGARTLVGDMLSVAAGLFYVGYLVLVQRARATLGSWSLLFWASLAGAPVALAVALGLGEPVWPGSAGGHWWPLFTLALGSQVVGQGLLVYALRHFGPLIIGLALLTQPAVGVLSGWFAFGETLSMADALGMALVSASLVLARLGQSAR
jgi:drug/metabolite transporter (DMT)-like permease